jgi:hypothetical protein
MPRRDITGNPPDTLWQISSPHRRTARLLGKQGVGLVHVSVVAAFNIPPLAGKPDKYGVARDKDGVVLEPVELLFRRWEINRGINHKMAAVLLGLPVTVLRGYIRRHRVITLEAALIFEAVTGGAVPCDAWLQGYEGNLLRFHRRRAFLITKLRYRDMVRRMARGISARAMAMTAMLDRARRKYGHHHTIEKVMEEEVAAGERHVKAHRRNIRMLLRTTRESPEGGWDE